MSRNQGQPPRRLFLGILLLSVSLLTALGLPGARTGAGGPFGQIWVRFWAGCFGFPWVWFVVLSGCVWALGLMLRWPRGLLWRQLLLLWPGLAAGDALRLSWGAVATEPLTHGRLGYSLHQLAQMFFGAASGAQIGLALGSLSALLTLLFLRYGLPRPMSEWMARALAFAGRALLLVGRLLARAGVWLALALGRRVLLPLARWTWRALAAVARAIAGRLARPAGDGDATPLSGEEEDDGGADPLGPVECEEPDLPAVIRPLAPETARAPRAGRREVLEIPPAKTPPRAAPAQRRASAGAPRAVANIDLLSDALASAAVGDEEIRANAVRLKETLASFGIDGEVGEVHPGPVITQYEFVPGVGVTISQITSRQDDLALALRAHSLRLVAPIPGKAAVGVEIPNREPALISFKEIVARREFLAAADPLTLALGKDVNGRPFYAAMDAMPHLLVAGRTGSGKSVCLNTLIVSLLLRLDPSELRLLLIDPKMLELTVYNGIPHLLKPVLTDSRESARALAWMTREMERRYRVFSRLGVRNIDAYRRRATAAPDEAADAAEWSGAERRETMPYIVVFVDELADLIMTNQAEVEIPVARLAQMARAVGIHLVLATQRPSVDVITGVIKANFPARIAFQVASRVDSRTILDMNGAESLIGRGDMLFIPPGKAQAHRVHGAFISDAEIESVAAYLRQFPPADELAAIESEQEESTAREDLEDPLFHDAMRIVVVSQQGSTSFLQRRLRIGYTRAGRLMDLLERAGIVGPPDGSRAREVLVPPTYLDQAAGEDRAAQEG